MREEAPSIEKNESTDVISRSNPSHPISARLEIVDTQTNFSGNQSLQESEQHAPHPYLYDEQLFKEHLVGLAATLEEKFVVDFNPVICGRTIPLFRLWQVVRSEDLGGYEEVTGRNLWPQVASRLNFSFQHPHAHIYLRMCYEEILTDFELWLEYQESEELTESQEQGMIESQLRQTAENEAGEFGVNKSKGLGEDYYDNDLDAPSSIPEPPASPSPKRSFDDGRTTVRSTYNKRQRISKGKNEELEIPSTPEDAIVKNPTPHPSYQRSPLNLTSSAIAVNEKDEPYPGPLPRPNFSRTSGKLKQTSFEPETQDFHFPMLDDDDKGSFVLPPTSSPTKVRSGSIEGPVPQDPTQDPMDEDEASRSSPSPYSAEIPKRAGHSNTAFYGGLTDDSSTQSQTESQRENDIKEYIDRYVALGYSDNIVIEALEATTMETGDAGFVMEQLTNGAGIPENHQGVWTTRDDEALEAPEDSAEFLGIVEKHGMKRVVNRNRFLQDMKAVRRESEEFKD